MDTKYSSVRLKATLPSKTTPEAAYMFYVLWTRSSHRYNFLKFVKKIFPMFVVWSKLNYFENIFNETRVNIETNVRLKSYALLHFADGIGTAVVAAACAREMPVSVCLVLTLDVWKSATTDLASQWKFYHVAQQFQNVFTWIIKWYKRELINYSLYIVAVTDRNSVLWTENYQQHFKRIDVAIKRWKREHFATDELHKELQPCIGNESVSVLSVANDIYLCNCTMEMGLYRLRITVHANWTNLNRMLS